MQLSLGDGHVIDDPTDLQIADILQALDGKDDSFAILTASDGSLVQCAGDPDRGFVLEYNQASENRLFERSRLKIFFQN